MRNPGYVENLRQEVTAVGSIQDPAERELRMLHVFLINPCIGDIQDNPTNIVVELVGCYSTGKSNRDIQGEARTDHYHKQNDGL